MHLTFYLWIKRDINVKKEIDDKTLDKIEEFLIESVMLVLMAASEIEKLFLIKKNRYLTKIV